MFENEDLDLADFDPVEYINRQFPSEASLDGLDAFIAKTDQEIKFLNSSISDVCCVPRVRRSHSEPNVLLLVRRVYASRALQACRLREN